MSKTKPCFDHDARLLFAAKNIAAARYRLAMALGDLARPSPEAGCSRAVFACAAQEALDGLEAERDRHFHQRHGRAPKRGETEAEAADATDRLRTRVRATHVEPA